MHKPQQDVGAPFVAHLQPPIATSHASDRSTTYRWRPSRSLASMPRRAIRGRSPAGAAPAGNAGSRSPCRNAAWSGACGVGQGVRGAL